MDLLIEHATQAGGIESEARGLRANIRGQVEGSIGVEIGMAIEAGHAQALVCALAVLGLVELLLREGREQKAKPLHLDRGENANHQLVVVLDRQQLPARHIAQFRMGGEEQGRRKFGSEAVREIQINIEAPQVASFLPANLVNLVVRENLTTGGLLDMGQRHEAGRQEAPLADFVRAHGCQALPGHTGWKLDADAALDGLTPSRHHHPGDGLVGQVIALVQQIGLSLPHLRLLGLVRRLHGREGQGREGPVGCIGRKRIGQRGQAARQDKSRRGRQDGFGDVNHSPLHWYGVRPLWNSCGLPQTRCCWLGKPLSIASPRALTGTGQREGRTGRPGKAVPLASPHMWEVISRLQVQAGRGWERVEVRIRPLGRSSLRGKDAPRQGCRARLEPVSYSRSRLQARPSLSPAPRPDPTTLKDDKSQAIKTPVGCLRRNPSPVAPSWIAAGLESIGGPLLLLGLFTRPVAFILAGEMAVAYWTLHAPRSIFPVLNQGDAAILYCFIFLYLVFAGPGPWSLDALMGRETGERRGLSAG